MFNSSDPSGRAPKRVLLSILAGALPPDIMYIDIDDGNPGSGQEWQITLDFPSGTSAVGAASSVDIEYIDHINGTNEMTFYCEPSGCSATGVQFITPEPSSGWLTGMAGAGLTLALRRRRIAIR